jgi:hypothetical protein
MTKENYTIDYLENLTQEYLMNLTEIEQQKLVNNMIRQSSLIYAKLGNKVPLSYSEKELLYDYSRIKIPISKSELLEKFPEIFEDFYFLELYERYRTYLENDLKVPVVITQIESKYIKPLNQEENEILENFRNEWKTDVLEVNNGKPGLESRIKKEVKRELELYFKENENISKKTTPIIKDSDRFIQVLHSKWVYLLSKKIIESYENKLDFYILKLNNTTIKFTPESLIHILYKHYCPVSKIAKKYKDELECSHHNQNVDYEKIHIILEYIFNLIDNSSVINFNLFEKLTSTNEIEINFQYKSDIYSVWISLNLNENGNKEPFNEIATFYRLTNYGDINKLKRNFTKQKINDELYFYVPKIS